MKTLLVLVPLIATVLFTAGSSHAQNGIVIRGVLYDADVLEGAYSEAKKAYYMDGPKPILLASSEAVYLCGKVIQVAEPEVVIIAQGDRDIAVTNMFGGDLVERDEVECIAVRCGVYRYITVLGASRQIAAYWCLPLMTRREFVDSARKGYFGDLLTKYNAPAPSEPRDRVLVRKRPLGWNPMGWTLRGTHY